MKRVFFKFSSCGFCSEEFRKTFKKENPTVKAVSAVSRS